jgi:hypothetical protein
MKKIILILSLVVISLYATSSYFYNKENITPAESDLSKYPEISSFLIGRTDFRGIRFNLDTNYYSFAFHTSLPTSESYFSAVDTIVKKDDWLLISSEQNIRVYRRKKHASVDVQQFDKVTLSYDSDNKEVTIIREDE